MNSSLIAVFGVVLVFAGSSDAINCYECTSVTSSGCGDPFSSSSTSIPCVTGVCMKTSGGISSATAVVRSCAPSTTATGCSTQSLFGVSETTCYCSTNNCNAGSSLIPAGVLSLVLMALFQKIAAFIV